MSRPANTRQWIEKIDPKGRMTLDSLIETNETITKMKRRSREIIDGTEEKGLLMLGIPGLAKTHVMIAMARELMEKREKDVEEANRKQQEASYRNEKGYWMAPPLQLNSRSVAFESVIHFVARVQDSYSNPEAFGTRSQIIDKLASKGVVLLDDLGKERVSPDVDTMLYELFHMLDLDRRTVVISSNLSLERYESDYDDATRSRIAGMCDILIVEGDDYRRKS